MRRFGWQIGGVLVAVAGVAVLCVLAFGRSGAAGHFSPTARPSVSASPSPTADPRVAEVEEAARRYVQALQDSAKTGDPGVVDALVVPGSQAAGNAGIASSFSRDNHYAFIASGITYSGWRIDLTGSAASVDLQYTLVGHAADWPSLRPRESDHAQGPIAMHLEFELHGASWLVLQSS